MPPITNAQGGVQDATLVHLPHDRSPSYRFFMHHTGHSIVSAAVTKKVSQTLYPIRRSRMSGAQLLKDAPVHGKPQTDVLSKCNASKEPGACHEPEPRTGRAYARTGAGASGLW